MMKTRESVYVLSSDERSTLVELARQAVVRLEEHRGTQYSWSYRTRVQDQIRDEMQTLIADDVAQAIAAVGADLRYPVRPEREIERWEAAQERFDILIFRQRISEDAPGPTKPSAVADYEISCDSVDAELRRRAVERGRYWLTSEKGGALLSRVVSARASRVRLASPRKPSPAVEPPKLVGEFDYEKPKLGSGGFVSAEQMILEVTPRLGRKLLPGEYYLRDGTTQTHLARKNERHTHRHWVTEMASLLKNLGYRVYPGDVGLLGVFAMADLLAYDESTIVFVEVLSPTSIQLGRHLGKRALAVQVPVCFVGPLPASFFDGLSDGSYGISHPNAWRMHDGGWVPRFRRLSGALFSPSVHVRRKRGRGRPTFQFDVPGLRTQEDVAPLLRSALLEIHRRTPLGSHPAFKDVQVEVVDAQTRKGVEHMRELRLHGSLGDATLRFRPLGIVIKGRVEVLKPLCLALADVGIELLLEEEDG